ncbi:MAG: cytochrome P450 [Pseudomonas sp.]
MTSAAGACLPPGPRGGFLVGNALDFAEDPLGFLRRCADRYGDLSRIARHTYLASHPELVRQVFQDRDGVYAKVAPGTTRTDTSAFPASVMNSEGGEWRAKRQTLQGVFHSMQVRDGVARALAAIGPSLDGWRELPPDRDIRREMEDLCLRVGGDVLLAAPIERDEARHFVATVDAIMGLTRSPVRFPRWLPTPGNLRLRRAHARLDRGLDRIVARHRAGPADRRPCLLGALLHADPGGGSAWLRDELATMVMSGLEPMADGLTWTLHLLAGHPDAQRRVLAELQARLGERAPLDPDAVADLRYAGAVVRESLRLYPPAWMTGRIAMRDTRLGDFDVPAGTQVVVSQWVSHRDPRYFAAPDTFAPERWLPPRRQADPPRYAYFPFGGGARHCVGGALAMAQMTAVIAAIVRAFEVAPAADAQPRPFPALVLRPLGVRLDLTARARCRRDDPHATRAGDPR